MRGMTRRWRLVDSGAPPAGRLIDRILRSRGLTDPEQIALFCDPRLTHLHPPAQMPGAPEAAERLVEAIRDRQTIAIYGDYDVDGITATAILYHIVKAADPEADIRSYVPHRLSEGYGLNEDAIREIAGWGTGLCISVDCGITATEPAAVARELGMDLVITDHHQLGDGHPLPDAFCLVHPRLPGSTYPCGDLCGAGVAFKLAWCFATTWCGSERVSKAMQQVLLDLLPLVALGTIADVVPLLDENRVLTRFGLRMMRTTPYDGLRALIEASAKDGEAIDTEKVGFRLAPRLNACGRMGHAREAVHLLTDANPDEAVRIATELTRLNQERQRTQQEIVDEASRLAQDSGQTRDNHRAIVLAHPDWHPGVIGIVCSRLVEMYHRPTILLQRTPDGCRGSARSIDGFSIYDGLAACSEHLTAFGGHDAAAGLSLPDDQLDAFARAFVTHANEHIEVEQLTPAVVIDCEATLAELTRKTVENLQDLAPFGRSNRRPVLRIPNLVVAEHPRQMGSDGQHLAIRVREDGSDGKRREMRLVWWSQGKLADDLAAGTPIEIAVCPKLNEFRGRVSVEGEIRDIRLVRNVEIETLGSRERAER